MSKLDEFLWLEDINSPAALNWVTNHNSSTLTHFKQSPFFKPAQNYLEKILGDDHFKLTTPTPLHNTIYRIEKNNRHPKGLWQKTSLESFLSATPHWATLLDIDGYCQQADRQNWIIHSMDSIVLSPNGQRALILFSVGGGDSGVWQEFDLSSLQFIRGGFQLPNAKSSVAWLDQDTIIFTLASEKYGKTSCGYPYRAYSLSRYQPLSIAQESFSSSSSIMSLWTLNHSEADTHYTLLIESHSFHARNYYLYTQNNWKQLPLPNRSFHLLSTSKKFIFFSSSDDGGLYALSLKDFRLTKIFSPSKQEFLEQFIITPISDNAICYTTLKNVTHHCYIAPLQDTQEWNSQEIPLPLRGTVAHLSSLKQKIFIRLESFLHPPTLYSYDLRTKEMNKLASQPQLFDPTKYSTKQLWATGQDGTRIPYFCIANKDQTTPAPTILNGYGGFGISLTPFYLREFGKLWLEQGGVFVLANIRGGGEFGPQWHKAAIKTNRQKAFDDFVAIAEDLKTRQITTAAQLGIMGGSNGGLLTSTVMTQRPELFAAACIEVPLTDMLRFHKLLAGSSWIAEYGTPDDPNELKALQSYSPYHQLDANINYPRPFFMTSQTDDRVHPGHARKMAAKMEQLGKAIYFYENAEGGHGGSSNYKQRALWITLELSYLHERLMK